MPPVPKPMCYCRPKNMKQRYYEQPTFVETLYISVVHFDKGLCYATVRDIRLFSSRESTGKHFPGLISHLISKATLICSVKDNSIQKTDRVTIRLKSSPDKYGLMMANIRLCFQRTSKSDVSRSNKTIRNASLEVNFAFSCVISQCFWW